MTEDREQKPERKLPTKEEWAAIIAELSGSFGLVKLAVDGYDLSITRGQIGKNKLGLIVYINGSIKGIWYAHYRSTDINPEIPEETRRFYRKKTQFLHSAKDRAFWLKVYGKKEAPKRGMDTKFISYDPRWLSATALKQHLLKNNHNIEVVKD
jgi:hypothetical protein